jgi:hypothetical protein
MAEPILGQALALQSEFRPDTTQVLTRAVDKIGNVTLKKQLAEAKAQEAKAKREQDMMAAIKLDNASVINHYLPEAQQIFTEGISKITEAAQKGDKLGAKVLEGEYGQRLKNIQLQSKQTQDFLDLKKTGILVAPEIEVAFSMPKAQGQAYLQEVYKQKPELRAIVDVNEYGDYVFNPVKGINLPKEYSDIIDNDAKRFQQVSQTVEGGRRIQQYEIPKERINELALQMANDRNYVINALYTDAAGVNAKINAIAKANPGIAKEQAEDLGMQAYFNEKLQSANRDYTSTAIPQGRTASGGPKVKILAKDFSPTKLTPEQVSSIADLSKIPSNKAEYSSINMPNISDVFSFTDDKGREFNAPVNNVTDYGDKLYLTGSAKNIVAEGFNVAFKYGTQSTTELTPSAWKALSVYYAKQGIDAPQLAKFMNNNLASAGSSLRIDPSTGRTYKQGATQPRPTSTAASVSTSSTPAPKKTIKESDIAAKAKAAGYTDSEYRKLLKQNNVTIVK